MKRNKAEQQFDAFMADLDVVLRKYKATLCNEDGEVSVTLAGGMFAVAPADVNDGSYGWDTYEENQDNPDEGEE